MACSPDGGLMDVQNHAVLRPRGHPVHPIRTEMEQDSRDRPCASAATHHLSQT